MNDIITQAELFAKDFNIDLQKYPRLKCGVNTVSYRAEHNANGTGGWSEGEPALTVPRWIVEKYYELSKASNKDVA